jgi:hypothetical protein
MSVNEKLEKYKDLLWCDLKTDIEKAEFLEAGRAYQTGIIAPGITDEVATAFRFKYKHEKHRQKSNNGN